LKRQTTGLKILAIWASALTFFQEISLFQGTELKMAFYVADFAIEFVTGRLLDILSHYRMTCSAINEKYRDIFLKSIPEKGVVKLMTDNLKENTHKTIDNTLYR